MIDAGESIPEDGIFLVEAFEYVFRTTTQNWRDLEKSAYEPHLHGRERPEMMQRADAKYDRAQLEANKWLRDRIGDRSITALICGPNGQLRQLTCEGWENVGFAKTGISANFVSPDDPMNPGPDTTIDGVRYPVFFRRGAFEKLVEVEFGAPPKSPPLSGETLEPGAVKMLPEPLEPERVETPEPARPAEPKLLKPAAWFDDVRKDNPKRKNELPGGYAARLHLLMQEAHEAKHVAKLWPLKTLLRRLYDG